MTEWKEWQYKEIVNTATIKYGRIDLTIAGCMDSEWFASASIDLDRMKLVNTDSTGVKIQATALLRTMLKEALEEIEATM